MAYLSGGAIFHRSTLKDTDIRTQICGGGVAVFSSIFYQNLGMIKSNGGAMTIICDYLDKYDLKDYLSTGRVSKVNTTGYTITQTK
jgi:hypothetical protein